MALLNINRYSLLVMLLSGIVTATLTYAQASTVISTSLCGVVNNVREIVGVIALLLFIVGGALYAVAHMMPAAGNLRANLQGWSLGMIVGSVVGLIIVILAPYVISTLASSGGVSTVTTC